MVLAAETGGQLLIVDGDFVTETWASRLRKAAEGLWARRAAPAGGLDTEMQERHRSILSRVYFSQGARAEDVCRLLAQAGFKSPMIDTRFGSIHRAQARQMGFFKSLERAAQYRYAVCARRPALNWRAASGRPAQPTVCDRVQ
jgi:hypothetical protein